MVASGEDDPGENPLPTEITNLQYIVNESDSPSICFLGHRPEMRIIKGLISIARTLTMNQSPNWKAKPSLVRVIEIRT